MSVVALAKRFSPKSCFAEKKSRALPGFFSPLSPSRIARLTRPQRGPAMGRGAQAGSRLASLRSHECRQPPRGLGWVAWAFYEMRQ